MRGQSHLSHGEAEALSEGVLVGPHRQEGDVGLVPFPPPTSWPRPYPPGRRTLLFP